MRLLRLPSLLLAGLLIGLAAHQAFDGPAAAWPPSAVENAPAAAALAPLHPDAAAPLAAPAPLAAAPAGPPPRCAYQQLDIAGPTPGEALRACVSATRVEQVGDLRRHVLAPQGVSPWTLRIDSGDGVVMAARLSAPGLGDYVCDEGSCSGFAIGPRDRHGERALTVSGALLAQAVPLPMPTPNTAAAPAATVRLSAQLKVPGDQQTQALACSGASIAVVERAGAAYALCPSAGASMARLADGRRVFGLRSLAGDQLLVGVAADGAVDQVQLGGLSCTGTACSGATTQPRPVSDSASAHALDQAPSRAFSFAGTTLTDGRAGGPSATLNGSATLPGP